MHKQQLPLTPLNLMDRRSVLKRGAAASALPFLNATAQATGGTQDLGETMRVLSEYMAQAAVSPLPVDVIEHAKQHIMDTLAAIVSGGKLEPGKAAYRYLQQHVSPGKCSIMGSKRTASFKAAHDKARMNDPLTLVQRSKVVLVKDEALSALLPTRVAIVEVVFKDGTRLSQKVEAVRGTPLNPMTRQEVIDKAIDLMNPVLGQVKTKQLIRTVFDLETLPRVQSLRPLLQA